MLSCFKKSSFFFLFSFFGLLYGPLLVDVYSTRAATAAADDDGGVCEHGRLVPRAEKGKGESREGQREHPGREYDAGSIISCPCF